MNSEVWYPQSGKTKLLFNWLSEVDACWIKDMTGVDKPNRASNMWVWDETSGTEGLEKFTGWNIAVDDLQGEKVYKLSQDSTPDLTIKKVQSKQSRLPVPGQLITSNSKAKEEGYRFEIVFTPATQVLNESVSTLPEWVEMEQNYPNPFNPVTTITYLTPRQSSVRLEVFDMSGRRVATLVDESQTAGSYSVSFDSRQLASGMYMYRLQAGNSVLIKKLTLVKLNS